MKLQAAEARSHQQVASSSKKQEAILQKESMNDILAKLLKTRFEILYCTTVLSFAQCVSTPVKHTQNNIKLNSQFSEVVSALTRSFKDIIEPE